MPTQRSTVTTRGTQGPPGPTGPQGPQGTMPSEGVGDGRYTLTTANSSPTTIATITIADETIVAIEAYCEAKLAGSGTCAIIAKRDVYKRTAAAAPSQVDPVEVLIKRPSSTTYDVSFAVSGNAVLVQVTGAANVKWTAEVKALKLTDG